MAQAHTPTHGGPSYPTVAEISAELLGSRRARGIRGAIARGEIEAYDVGGTRRVRRTDVEEWLARQRVRAPYPDHARRVIENRLAHEARNTKRPQTGQGTGALRGADRRETLTQTDSTQPMA